MLITFSSLAPRCRIDRLLDPTTSYSCLSNKTQTAMSLHIPANFVRLCYYCSLLSHCLVCMLGCYKLLSCYSLDWAITLLYYCGGCDYYNVDYIRRRMEGLGYPAPTLCSIHVT